MFGACDAGGPGSIEHHTDFANVFAHNFQCIQKGGARDDRCSVLVIVKHGDLHGLAQCLFDVEAVGGLYVFQIDAAKGRLQQLAQFDDLVRIVSVHLDIKDVDVGETFKKDSFALHNRLAGQSADVAESIARREPQIRVESSHDIR